MPSNSEVLVGDIASAAGLAESHLAKILRDLAKEGIVPSHRAVKGGFSLARPANQITLREVIEAIDGPIALNRCLAPWEGCGRQETCPLYPGLAEAEERLLATLDRATLQDLAAGEDFATTN